MYVENEQVVLKHINAISEIAGNLQGFFFGEFFY